MTIRNAGRCWARFGGPWRRQEDGDRGYRLPTPISSRRWWLFALVPLGSLSLGQEAVRPPHRGEEIRKGHRETIKENVIRKETHSVTIREVVPPAPTARETPPPRPPSRREEEKVLPRELMFVVATRFDDRATLLEWWAAGQAFKAWSPADFQILEGQFEFEARGLRYQVMCLVSKGTVPEQWDPEMSERQRLIFNGPTNEALGTGPTLVTGQFGDGTPLDFLFGIHDHYRQNRQRLEKAFEAKVQARQIAPVHPPLPKPKNDSKVTYWKYHQSNSTSRK